MEIEYRQFYSGRSLGKIEVVKVHNRVRIWVDVKNLEPVDKTKYKTLEVLYG